MSACHLGITAFKREYGITNHIEAQENHALYEETRRCAQMATARPRRVSEPHAMRSKLKGQATAGAIRSISTPQA